MLLFDFVWFPEKVPVNNLLANCDYLRVCDIEEELCVRCDVAELKKEVQKNENKLLTPLLQLFFLEYLIMAIITLNCGSHQGKSPT